MIWISAFGGLPVLTREPGRPMALAIWSAMGRAFWRATIVVWDWGRGASATSAIVKPACLSRSAVRAARPATPAPFRTSTEIDDGASEPPDEAAADGLLRNCATVGLSAALGWSR